MLQNAILLAPNVSKKVSGRFLLVRIHYGPFQVVRIIWSEIIKIDNELNFPAKREARSAIGGHSSLLMKLIQKDFGSCNTIYHGKSPKFK